VALYNLFSLENNQDFAFAEERNIPFSYASFTLATQNALIILHLLRIMFS